jgi:YegS/Rv2252/BmrU family lipid kinase
VAAAKTPRRALLLINPGARRGGEPIDAALERLRAGGIEVEEARSDSDDDKGDALRAQAEGFELVIVAGGDGTLCRAAPGILASGLPLGILPTGTANDLARTLGIPPDLDAAAEIIVAGHRRRIDVGSVNDHPFFNVASIGLSAELARELSPDLKRRWGRVGYALAAIGVLMRARRFAAWIGEDGDGVVTRTLQISVGNGVFYGGGTVVAADAAIDDGHLDLYSLEMRRVWKLALMLPVFRAGTHGAWSEVRTARNVAFEIRTREPLPVNADGELLTRTPARFRVHSAALEVFAPAAASD